MFHNGAQKHRRLTALVLAWAVLLTACFTPALAADIWSTLDLRLRWTDGAGTTHEALATPLTDSADRAYWVKLDPGALGQRLTVEAYSSDPSYAFYLYDEAGGQTTSFDWLPEMDALSTGLEYAHQLFYSVNGMQTDMPVMLYVSTMDAPQSMFQPFPVQVSVYYVTEDGFTLDAQSAECWAGETTYVWAASANTAGYELIGADNSAVYVDENGYASPSQVTFTYRQTQTPTPEPTDAPTPTPVAEVSVPVVYMHVSGEQLDFQEVFLAPGTHEITASSSKVSGYQPVGSTTAHITVYADGTTDLPSIIFTYEDVYVAPAEATVYVYYMHENGTQLDVQEKHLTEGTHTLYPESGYVSAYELTGNASADVTVFADGSVSAATVTFTYRDVYVAPAEATVYVYYMHENGTQLDVQEKRLTEGTHTLYPESGYVSAYELTGNASADVTVFADGSVSAAMVTFTYRDVYVAPAEATVYVYYMHENGTQLDVQEKHLTEGTHTLYPESGYVSAYELTGNASADVTVFADGSVSAATVTFTYRDVYVAPAEATVYVYYMHENGTQLDVQEKRLTEGTHTLYPESGYVSAYELTGNASADVTVFADGSVSAATVTFTYRDVYVAPTTAELNILYQTADGTVVANDVMYLAPNTYLIQPDLTKLTGYVPVREQTYEVTVNEAGQISQEMVVFEVRRAAATITVHYLDNLNRDVAPVQVFTYEDGSYTIQATPEGIAAEYELAPGSPAQVTVDVQDGIASQADVYFYYQQKQTEIITADITVHYYALDGNEIATPQTLTLHPGTTPIYADDSVLPAGEEWVEPSVIEVTVDEYGRCDSEEIAFYCRMPRDEKQAELVIYYQDTSGNAVATSQTRLLDEGQHIIEAAPLDLQAGYVLFDGMSPTETVRVADGVATPAKVVFYYTLAQSPPTEFTLPVHYYDTEGRRIATSQTVTLAPGIRVIAANPTDLPDGYTIAMDALLTVTVNQDGTTDPAEIAFYYRAPEKRATVTIRYQDENRQPVIAPFTTELSPGYHIIEVDVSLVPDTYDPTSAEEVQVYVSSDGVADPSEVIFTLKKLIIEPTIPVGEHVYRYATVTAKDVGFRSEPSAKSSKSLIKRIAKNTRVYVLKEVYNDAGEVWALVNIGGTEGYMSSEFLQIMSRADSDAYAAAYTPAPTFTPVPTATPTASPTATPTEIPTPTASPTSAPTDSWVSEVTQAPIELVTEQPTVSTTPRADPTESASPTPTASPTPSPSPTPYIGYALTTRVTPLRSGVSHSDMTIVQELEANELVRVFGQVMNDATQENWSIVSTLNDQSGYVQDASLRPITDREAEIYIAQWEALHASPAPTEYISPTPEPMQVDGYGVVLGEGVPFRQMASEYSRIIDNLPAGTVVFISGQTAGDGQYWHNVYYNNAWGYIRTDLIRMMTLVEEEDYIASQHATPTPDPSPTTPAFDANGLSSYGYVTGNSVNWREEPSTNAERVGRLNRYALCLVLDTATANGTTWYKVSYNDKVGYIHMNYFQQLTVTELTDFLSSDDYMEGWRNNTSAGDVTTDDVGFTGTGGLVSAEDQWVNKNPDVYASFEPFNPIPTVAPIVNTPALEPLPNASQSPTASPSPTPTFNPLPDVTYPTSDDGKGGSTVAWFVVIALLILAGGGLFALVQYQQKRRRIAMRAAQRRAQAARAQQQQQQRPYARTNQGSPARTGTFPSQQTAMRQPIQPDMRRTPADTEQSTARYAPYSVNRMENYARPTADEPIQGSDFTPDDEADTRPVPRVGRRSAYRRQQEDSDDTLDI